MIPAPGYDFLYLNTQKLSPDLVCEALRDNPRIMVDRATRKACGMPETTAPAAGGRIAVSETPATKETVEDEQHAGMEMRHDDHGQMHEHWMAPAEAAKRTNAVPADRASIERGGKLYQTHCVVCHGPTGLGDGPAGAALKPKPTNLVEMAGQHPAGDLAWKIENGRGAMPAWKGILSESQIWDLVNYIKSLGREEHLH
jgi:mono/diheme cytochrome c family protein